MSTKDLRDLTKNCTVHLKIPGQATGTGFFVAPGLILTCAHVIKSAQEDKRYTIEAYTWDNKPLGQAIIEQYMLDEIPIPSLSRKETHYYPDLALLRVAAQGHSCVYLFGKLNIHDALYSYGYIERYNSGDGVEFKYEAESRFGPDDQWLLKLKEGQARPGLSGAPLLNEVTGAICGVMQQTRGAETDLGGRAIPLEVVFKRLPELVEQQKQFHQSHDKWLKLLTSEQKQALGIAITSETHISDPTQYPVEIFYSYATSQKDEVLRDELIKQLSTLRRNKDIIIWDPAKTSAAETPDEYIKQHLSTSHIILLLVSSDYISSDEIIETHVTLAMMRKQAGNAIIIPILLRSVDNWVSETFGSLLTLPRNNKPIDKWPNRDEACMTVAGEIRKVVTDLKAGKIVLKRP